MASGVSGAEARGATGSGGADSETGGRAGPSGWGDAANWALARDIRFRPTVWTGSHQNSVRAVAAGEADFATIDDAHDIQPEECDHRCGRGRPRYTGDQHPKNRSSFLRLQLSRGDARLDEWANHAQHIARQLAGNLHLRNFIFVF